MNKVVVPINFSQGLNQKVDPWQIAIGQFEELVNSVFKKGGLLLKRDGYGLLPSVTPNSYITTLNENLIGIGDTISAYSQSLGEWVTKGTLKPCALSTLPLIRNNKNQSQADSIVGGGLICTVYTETNITSSATVTNYFYVVADSTTGQNIISPTLIPAYSGAISGSSRVFVLGNYFVIVSQVLVAGVTHLQYFSIPLNNPSATPVPAQVTSEAYVPTTGNPGWDAVSINNVSNKALIVSYNTNTGGQGVHTALLTLNQIIASATTSNISSFTNAAYISAIATLTVDDTVNPQIFYLSFWNNITQNGYTCAFSITNFVFTTIFSPTISIAATPVANLASSAQNNSCLLFYEVPNGISDNEVAGVTISVAGAVGAPYAVIRSVGLASKSFIANGTIYFLAAHSSPFQPTYFLINGSLSTSASPIITAKLAYENGGGYLFLGLPGVYLNGSNASIAYLFKDLVEALNTLNNPQQTTAGGIYSQTGINFVTFSLDTKLISSSELAANLHVNGGFLGQFDGYLPVEHNFFLWPEGLTTSYNATSTVTPTGTFSNGSFTIVLSSAAGVFPGMSIIDTSNPTFIPAGTQVVTVNGTTITISKATTSAGAANNLSIQGNIAAKPDGVTNTNAYYYQATYEWTDNQGLAYRSAPSIPVAITTTGSGTAGTVTLTVPTLRLTAKVANPVKIVIYRWSPQTGVYNQVTSIIAPVLNDTTIDSVTFVDTLSDANVVGNNIIYTTGGVVEDINAPSFIAVNVFDTRLWGIDAEDPNVLWVSKQVIKGTPVEMSDLFTIYVAPNIGTSQSTGPMKCLAPMDDKNILFKPDAIYYINGVGPDNLGTTAPGCSLGNYSQPTFITSTVGCDNQNSIVLIPDGLLFQSNKGIWILNRQLQTQYIGAQVENFNSSRVTSANAIPETNFVVFTLDTGQMLMYDYYFRQWGVFEGAPAISSCIYQDLHTLLDPNGRVLQQTPGEYVDAGVFVKMRFTTGWFNVAQLQGYERLYDFYLLAKYLSPHSLFVQTYYNFNDSAAQSKIIRPTNVIESKTSPFGNPTPFGSSSDLEQWRIHAKQQLCQSFKISVSEVFDPTLNDGKEGAGFTMSGLSCRLGIKRATRPIRAKNTVGVS